MYVLFVQMVVVKVAVVAMQVVMLAVVQLPYWVAPLVPALVRVPVPVSLQASVIA